MRRRRNRGAAALETAACLPFLVLLLTASADYAWLALVQHQMNHAARSASRYGITGQGDPLPVAGNTPVVRLCDGGQSNDRLDRIRAIVTANAGSVLKPGGLCLELGSYGGFQAVGRPEPLADVNGNGRHDGTEAFTDINGNGRWDADQATPSPGGSDQIAIYTLRYVTAPLTGLTPGLGQSRRLQFETRVVVRNEPF
ncbi:MAG: TadE family protein [Sandaracinobacteroides sp.]